MATQTRVHVVQDRPPVNQPSAKSWVRLRSAREFAIPYTLISWLAPLAIVVAWELLVDGGVIPARILPAPSKVFNTAGRLTNSGVLVNNLLVSLGRAAIGFAIGGVIALTLGFTVGLSRLAEAILDRPIQMIRTIPFLALIPLVIVWFGIGEEAKIFLVALGVTFPIYINTVLGIRQVDPRLVELGRNYGLGKQAVIWQVILPGALPSILVGLRFGLGIAWLALVVAETVGASSGIGFMAMDAREFLQTDVIVLAIIIYAVLGILVDVLVRGLERRLLVWHPSYTNRAR